MSFPGYQTRPPRHPLVAAVVVIGGTFACLAVILAVGSLITNTLPRAAFSLGIASLIIGIIQAIIGGLILSRWQRHPGEGNFYLSFVFIFLLMLWIGIGVALIELSEFNLDIPIWIPLYLPILPLLWMALGLALGVALFLPPLIVSLRERKRRTGDMSMPGNQMGE